MGTYYGCLPVSLGPRYGPSVGFVGFCGVCNCYKDPRQGPIVGAHS